jgi:vacuolar-type H+-ATPase subunit F/Vma7
VSAIVALGERRLVEDFLLAGVRVVPAENEREVRAAWNALGADAAVVLLTARARDMLMDLLPLREGVIWTVIPD